MYDMVNSNSTFIPKPIKRDKGHNLIKRNDNRINVAKLLRTDKDYVETMFVSSMMKKSVPTEEMLERFSEKFGYEISLGRLKRLKENVRLIYIAQIGRNRQEQVADMLMEAEWETQELKAYWERSKQGDKKQSEHKANSSGDESMNYTLDETTMEVINKNGDIEVFRRLDAIEQRKIKVLGLEAPKVDPNQQQQSNGPAFTINIVNSRKDLENIQEAEVVNDEPN